MILVIGNKNYSSWSLRAWLFLRAGGVEFEEIRLPLDTDEFHRTIGRYSPAGKVPVLVDGDLTVWDSLAICEYAAERFPETNGWPADPAARARARSVSAEMHSGFPHLRARLPMNCRRRIPGFAVPEAAAADVARVRAIWSECRSGAAAAGGPFLFGPFGIADAMYAPVALRFVTYDVALDAPERAYVDALLALPALQEWLAAAAAETEVIPSEEV